MLRLVEQLTDSARHMAIIALPSIVSTARWSHGPTLPLADWWTVLSATSECNGHMLEMLEREHLFQDEREAGCYPTTPDQGGEKLADDEPAACVAC